MEETGFDMIVQEDCQVPVMVRHFVEETGHWRGCSRGLSSACNDLGTEWRRQVVGVVVQEDCRVPVMVRHFLEEETGRWRGCSRGLLSVSVMF